MNKLFAIFLIMLCLIACKEDNVETKEILISAQTGQNVSYKLSEALPMEGGYSISKQAINHDQSEITFDQVNGGIIYKYRSKETFKGTEKVEIQLESSIGDQNLYLDQILRFTIEVK